MYIPGQCSNISFLSNTNSLNLRTASNLPAESLPCDKPYSKGVYCVRAESILVSSCFRYVFYVHYFQPFGVRGNADICRETEGERGLLWRGGGEARLCGISKLSVWTTSSA